MQALPKRSHQRCCPLPVLTKAIQTGRHTHTHTDTQTQTDRQTDRHTHTHTHTHKDKDRDICHFLRSSHVNQQCNLFCGNCTFVSAAETGAQRQRQETETGAGRTDADSAVHIHLSIMSFISNFFRYLSTMVSKTASDWSSCSQQNKTTVYTPRQSAQANGKKHRPQ